MLNLKSTVYVQVWQPIFKEVETLVAARPWLDVSNGVRVETVNVKSMVGAEIHET